MSDFPNSTHKTNWIFTKEQLHKLRTKKHEKFRECVCRAIAPEAMKAKQVPGNPQATAAFLARRVAQDPKFMTKIADKEVTPNMEITYINSYIAFMLKTWPEIPFNVKVFFIYMNL